MTIAEPTDIEVSLHRALHDAETKYASALLERVESFIRVRIPDVVTKAATDANFRQIVVSVESEAVARVYRNPSAVRSETEGNYSYQVNYQVASGLLDILDSEWERLGIGSGAGAIAPGTDGYIATRRPDSSVWKFFHA